MLMNFTVIPFMIGMIVNVSKITNFDPEYLYELNQTTIVYKEPLQITQLTSTIKCHPFPPISLRCFLHDILYVTKFEHKNLNIIEEVTRERFKIGQWFEMKFSIEGLQSTLVRKDADNIVRNAIKYFVWQFDIGINIQHFIPLFKSRFTTTVMKFEKTSIADCTTELNFDVQRMMIPPDPYLNFDFTLTMKEDYTKYQYSRFLIEKNRIDCTPTFEYNDFLNSLVIKTYKHTIKSADYKIKAFTRLDVGHPSYTWNPTEVVFSDITEVNMIEIIFNKTLRYDNNYELILLD